MQRAVQGIGKCLPKATVAVAGTSSAHCRAAEQPSPNNVSYDEVDGWGVIFYRKEEISSALSELCTVNNRVTPLIAEPLSSDDESDATHGSADRHFELAERFGPEDVVDSLSTIVGNVLNGPAGPQIQRQLLEDPEFRRLVRRCSSGPALPASAAPLLLPAPEYVHRETSEENQLHALLNALTVALAKIGGACVAVGSAIRHLPSDILTVIRGIRGGPDGHGGYQRAGDRMDGLQAAVTRIAVAVAVAVILRRSVVHMA